ncbi:AMP-binding protein [Methyloversatilis sp.]|uniref:AMP-binding protein n=1 Tax=Methyloversatilis sp. TaxID=2569862 RepID=UPI0027339F5E|nr:AMP-binding protein [Methyloversatilis sp.]MDP2870062.1 AMP-binding protein [Methyloversatilis sp.]MDP3454856.1 AMP-binding protein [Methyloversatilis sp.]MDP3576986.1 AMP-binding protein [Methyloversatilis sp.]
MNLDHRLLAILRVLAVELKPGAGDLSTFGIDHRLERDFGLDSLARVELLARIEREMGVRLGEAALAAETPRDLLRLIDDAPQTSTPVPGTFAPGPASGHFIAPPAELATLTAVLDWHVRHQGERIHIILLGGDGREEAISYAQLAAAARDLSAGLLARGVLPGSRIALMLPTGLDFFAAFYGVLQAGCVPVPLYPPARPAQLEEHLRRIAGILANAGARWFIADPRARAFAHALSGKCPTLAGIVTVAELSVPVAVAPIPPLPVPASLDLAFIQYTSGSTGEPKGVALTHANLLANIRAMRQAARATSADVFVSWLPLYHDMGLIGAGMGSMVVGFPLVLLSPLAFLARPACWLEAISRHRGTLSAAPNFAYEICANRLADSELNGLDLSCWRMACNGAEAVSPVTLDRFAARLAPYGLTREALAPVYGLAECSVGLTFPPPGRGPRIDHVARRALADERLALPVGDDGADEQAVPGCGHALPGHEIRIVDPAGRVLAERRVGRIQFRGPSATAGYFENPAATATLFDGDWLNTGDLGYLADGELFVTGREKDLIIRAGHNIHPQELEEAVGRIAGVRAGNVAVFPATDAHAGTERLVVLAEVRAAIDAHTRIRAEIERLAIELTGLPADEVVLAPPGTVLKTSSGKLRRAACRAAHEHGTLLRGVRSPRLQALGLLLDAASARLRALLRTVAGKLWSAFAWLVFALLAPPFWLLIALAPTLAQRRAAARTGARLALAAGGILPRVTGLENLPDNAPVVVVANHASYLDGLALTAALPARFAYVAKRELLDHPLSATPLRRLDAAFVERIETARGAEETRTLEARVRAGDSIVFFAEGTFREAPGLLPFRMGAFLVAARTGVPVVPVSLGGTRVLLPGLRRWPRYSPLVVTIHAPLVPAGADWHAALALRDASRAAILAQLGEPDRAA